ncbi:hypothetical protein CDD81_3168 [Ophiocordyceps australis]|uniref:Telomerase reverse transcriptase n=1 Tax=Ophiocordyceps australis TaxID=1399860 RepID=A0A2C5XEA3_9HYPO|nr:hypothetical protein CDD81_3168 [Ophiocordyceps australis]
MTRGLKRKRDCDASHAQQENGFESPVGRQVLEQCYASVWTLRDYVLCKLPSSSRLRRKKIACLGRHVDQDLAHLLETTLVCFAEPAAETNAIVFKQFLAFSQGTDDASICSPDLWSSPAEAQSEIVDFVIWLLFKRATSQTSLPKNVLCHGFRRRLREGESCNTTIPGLYSFYANPYVEALKQPPWPQLLALLGQSGHKIMVDLLLDCSLFVTLQAGINNYIQIAGCPLSTLDAVFSNVPADSSNSVRKGSEIRLLRHRVFYGKPTLSARGHLQPGFKHIHVLNRCPYIQPTQNHVSSDKSAQNEVNTTHILMYMFPRQFGLHNVFTSTVNQSQTSQRFQDYTLREVSDLKLAKHRGSDDQLVKVPKRLRGAARQLVRRLQILHGRCSYSELLHHYCPTYLDRHDGCATDIDSSFLSASYVSASNGDDAHGATNPVPNASGSVLKRPRKIHHRTWQSMAPPPTTESLVELACPHSHVSAFCQGVLARILPDEMWGDGDTRHCNKKTFLHNVDRFIKLRRFESMTLHQISQGLKMSEIAWLKQPGARDRPCQSETKKRLEIFLEFLYYVFDSLLMPLIKNNFYVTESNTHRNQVFYFRHDIWRLIAEPKMADVKRDMLEEIKAAEATEFLSSRRLGLGQMRLVPKGHKMRPIMNLKKRITGKASSKFLGPSINSMLGPLHAALKYEKDTNPSRLGSALPSLDRIRPLLADFKASLGATNHVLYFVKMDVRAAFDTIPQQAVLSLMVDILARNRYEIRKHAEIKPGQQLARGSTKTRAVRRWHASAHDAEDGISLADQLKHGTWANKKNTIFVENAFSKTYEATALLSLLAEHVQANLVKVGKKVYRQKTGIPQGSVLSSLLCDYIYAELEQRHLAFLDSADCLLMRAVDDFVLITSTKSKAIEFVHKMHGGIPEYGVEVNREKTLVNFDMAINGSRIASISHGAMFPYCGVLIDCKTLELAKDQGRLKDIALENTLTVDLCRHPGQNFQKKVLGAFIIQSGPMFFDTHFNSTKRVLISLHEAMALTCRKMCAYLRCLPKPRRPGSSIIIR